MNNIKCCNDIKVKCSKCGSETTVAGSDLAFEEVERNSKKMGPEIHHAAEWSGACAHCNEPVVLKADVWEYPVGAINDIQTSVEGGSLERDLNTEIQSDDDNEEEG